MVAYIVRRILWAGVLAVAMTFVTFVILFKIPNDPARFLVPNQNPTEHQLEVARAELGVDDPFFVQYGRFLWRAVHSSGSRRSRATAPLSAPRAAACTAGPTTWSCRGSRSACSSPPSTRG